MKTCTRCNLTKPFEEFGASRLGRDGRSSWCRPCFQAYTRGYQQRKRQSPAVKAAERAYAAAHREVLNARNRKSLKGATGQDFGGRPQRAA